MDAPVSDLLSRIDVYLIHHELLGRVVAMLAACREAGFDYRATCGYRSADEQDALYARGRSAPGQIVTNSRGLQSAHNFGLAIDFAHDLGPASAGRQAGRSEADYEVLGQQALEHGLAWGGNFEQKDRPHVQMPGFVTAAQLKPLGDVYRAHGGDGADPRSRELSRLRAVWLVLEAGALR